MVRVGMGWYVVASDGTGSSNVLEEVPNIAKIAHSLQELVSSGSGILS